MESCDITTQALHLMKRVIDGVDVRPEACSSSFTQEIFATDRVLKLVEKGIPFRLAYKQVAASLKEGHLENSLENILSKTHQGAPGNLNLSHAQAGVENFSKWLVSEKKKWAQMVQNLTGECLV